MRERKSGVGEGRRGSGEAGGVREWEGGVAEAQHE